jgi:hypothetical protein
MNDMCLCVDPTTLSAFSYGCSVKAYSATITLYAKLTDLAQFDLRQFGLLLEC